jgi:antitoxin component YwqK of YwqJK toxin-antitoxin module
MMKKLILFFIFLSTALTLLAQQEVDPNGYNVFYYKNGEKSSEGYMKDGKPDGYWKTYFESGIIKSEGNRKNFELDSIWTFYNDTGKVVLQINYLLGKKNGLRITYHEDERVEENFVDDLKQGQTTYFYNNGKIRQVVFYVDGLEEGIAKEFSKADGRVIKLIYYKKGFISDIENINRMDGSGLKQGVWKYFYENGKVKLEGEYKNGVEHGYFKEYTEDGNLVLTSKYIDGVLQEDVSELVKLDIKREYYSNGNVKIVASYKDDVPEGVRREYNEDGTIAEGFIFSKGIVVGEGIIDEEGIRDGDWKEFYRSGQLKSIGKYDKGKRIGEWKFYHPNGKIEQIGSYSADGKEEGTWSWYFATGELLREETYYMGMIDGYSIEYDEYGVVIAEGEYIEDYREGEWKFQYGDHKEEGEYLNGFRNGKWISYYPDGKTNFEGKFVDDEPHGRHTWYWPNGNKKTEGEYSMGLKDGEWIKYNMDGTPFISIIYNNGVEKRYDGVKIKIYDEDDKPLNLDDY